MSLTSSMSTLALKHENIRDDSTFESLEIGSSPNVAVWESWHKLRLTAHHGKKLIKKNFKPYHPKVKTFFLHEIDQFDLEPGEKVTIVMRTLKKLFGSISNSNSLRAKRVNAKLSFVRVKGLQHFKDGKSITDLIEFPDSYWAAYDCLIKAKDNKKQNQITSDQPKQRLETISESKKVENSRNNRLNNEQVSKLQIFRMKFEILPRIAKIIFEIIIFPFILIMAGLLIMNFTCKNAKKISKAEQNIVNI